MTEATHKSMTKTYLAVFGALAVLTAVTVGVSYIHFGRAGNITVALLIAFTKVALIAAFFMHLKFEGKLIHIIFYTAVFFILILLFLVLPDLGVSEATMEKGKWVAIGIIVPATVLFGLFLMLKRLK